LEHDVAEVARGRAERHILGRDYFFLIRFIAKASVEEDYLLTMTRPTTNLAKRMNYSQERVVL